MREGRMRGKEEERKRKKVRGMRLLQRRKDGGGRG